MPHLRTYKLFISHAWDYHDEYYRLVKMLNSMPFFQWNDYSVPFHDPFEGVSAGELKNKIREQIRQCSVFILLAGMWVKYHDWILFELKTANEFSKPILAIKPWGHQKIPEEAYIYADKIVGWNVDSIVKAIKELASQ